MLQQRVVWISCLLRSESVDSGSILIQNLSSVCSRIVSLVQNSGESLEPRSVSEGNLVHREIALVERSVHSKDFDDVMDVRSNDCCHFLNVSSSLSSLPSKSIDWHSKSSDFH